MNQVDILEFVHFDCGSQSKTHEIWVLVPREHLCQGYQEYQECLNYLEDLVHQVGQNRLLVHFQLMEKKYGLEPVCHLFLNVKLKNEQKCIMWSFMIKIFTAEDNRGTFRHPT